MLTDEEFRLFQEMLHGLLGINLKDTNKAMMLAGRIGARLRLFGPDRYCDFSEVLATPGDGETSTPF